jgi:hypothetical protein
MSPSHHHNDRDSASQGAARHAWHTKEKAIRFHYRMAFFFGLVPYRFRLKFTGMMGLDQQPYKDTFETR